MRICIPSRSRAGKIVQMLQRLPREYWDDTYVFVPDNQVKAYKNAMLPFPMVHVVPCGQNETIGPVRETMGNYVWACHQPYFLMIDDDVRFEIRVGDDVTNTRGCTIDDTRDCLQRIENKLMDGRWGMVGIQARQFQQGTGLGTRETLIKQNCRSMNVVGWRTDDFLTVSYRRVLLRSDFDTTLQLLRQGRPNINLCYWQHSQVNHAAGGCSDYRDADLYSSQAQALADLHPGLVTVVEKEYSAQASRSKLNAGKRKEVMINWKKAFGYDAREKAAA